MSGPWGMVPEFVNRLRGEKFVDVIQCRDDFASGNQLLKIVATEQLLVF